ncbi:MAG: helix-turn-helix transcriptional regulator [Pseudomonadota bacterium]|nr:helix-turn-helix transcriptional regulator [Pseudomonadota bacterium]
MEDFGKRLKHERERLGLSQTKFAEACGVGKTAQFNYERGERTPSSVYMDAVGALGADVHFIFSGTRAGKDLAYARAYSRLLYTIEMLLGLKENTLEQLCKERMELDDKADWFGEKPPGHDSSTNFAPWTDSVAKWLSTSTKPDRCIDLDLLADVLSKIEEHAKTAGHDLPPSRKSRAALMLYRAAKASGSVDRRMLEDAVKLAAS